jgi:AcrR family transcriptional regulator
VPRRGRERRASRKPRRDERCAHRGRPRSPEVDEAILAATLRLLREHGYDGTSIEAVAAEAGVGKAAIYRRYRDKVDLAAAALASLRDAGEVPDSGDGPRDLAELLRRLRGALDAAGMGMVGTLLVQEPHAPELLDRFRERAIGPGRAQGRAVLERAREIGELRADADVELALDMLAGSIFARHLAGGGYPPGWEQRVAEAVWRSVARP